MKKGFVMGKFAPFHKGHIYLIEQARAHCDALTILVCSDPADLIPGWLRYHWVRSSFPELDVRHLMGYTASSMKGEAALLMLLTRNLPSDVSILFGSGGKQKSIAQKLGIQHVEIDPERAHFPVSTAQIRANIQTHWADLPTGVRAHYLKRVALVGPESCGKSYLAEKLALHFDTVFVEEYGRTYCEKFGMDSTELDFAHVAGGQLYREDEMALEANKILFCDTDLIVTQVWSEVYFKGKCQPWIFWADHARRYDLFLLCAPDIPWVNDGLREFEGQRQWMFERLQQELESRGLRYEIIQGDFARRTEVAIHAVENLG